MGNCNLYNAKNIVLMNIISWQRAFLSILRICVTQRSFSSFIFNIAIGAIQYIYIHYTYINIDKRSTIISVYTNCSIFKRCLSLTTS